MPEPPATPGDPEPILNGKAVLQMIEPLPDGRARLGVWNAAREFQRAFVEPEGRPEAEAWAEQRVKEGKL